jgi:muramoyltetrapeptide carboxypeptidase LdcA involved in peptidoglycan recycling
MPQELLKPKKLHPGDRVAAVCLSWGGAGTFPKIYEYGCQQLKNNFDLEVISMRNTLRNEEELSENPLLRIEDLNEALEREDIQGIFTVIGGDDSIRLIPHFDFQRIRRHCKPFLGLSDTTITHLAFHKAGVSSFYGPSLMFGVADFGGMFPYSAASMKQVLMNSEVIGELSPHRGDSYFGGSDWSQPERIHSLPVMRSNPPWRWLQGKGLWQGRLFGGCIEVLNMANGTSLWPDTGDFWNDRILFLEYSGELAVPEFTLWFLRNLAAQGALSKISGLLFGRNRHTVSPEFLKVFEKEILRIIALEVRRPELPVIVDMDFGHVLPMMTLPLGRLAEIDCYQEKIHILESAVTD